MGLATKSIIHNRKILYFVFMVALVDFLYLVYTNDMSSVSIFILIFILTTFFSKNMVVIIFTSFIITNIIKYGMANGIKEGFDGEKEEEEEGFDGEKEEEEEGFDGEKEEEEEGFDGEKEEEEEGFKKKEHMKNKKNESMKDKESKKEYMKNPKTGTTKGIEKDPFIEENSPSPTQSRNNQSKTKGNHETVEGLSKLQYESVSNESDLFPEEKVLERMNKYKGLLETLNELSKNMSIFV